MHLDLTYGIVVGDSFHIFTGSRPDASDFTIESQPRQRPQTGLLATGYHGTIAVVPEPDTWTVIGLSASFIGCRLLRRRG